MTAKEALERIKKIEIVNAIDKMGCLETINFEEAFDFETEEEVEDLLKIIENDLKVLDFFKKLFVDIMPIRLIDLQGTKYFSVPNSDIRRPDTLLTITEEEYNLLKEWFINNLLKEYLKNEKQ